MNATASILRAPGARHLSVALLCLAAAALLPAVTLLPHPLVVALSLVMVILLLVHVTFRKLAGELDYFEVLIPFTVLQIVSYGVGTYFLLDHPKHLHYQSHYAYLVPAMALAVLAYVSLALGYEMAFPRLRPSSLIHLRLVGLRPVFFLAGVGFVGQTAGIMLQRQLLAGPEISGVLSGLQQIAPVFLAAWFLAWHTAWGSSLPGRRRFLTPALLVPQIAYAIYGTLGGKSFTITLFAMPAIAYWYARRRLPIRSLMAITLIGIFVVFPLYNTFRFQDRGLETGRRLERTLGEAQRWNRTEYLERSLEAFVSRMAVVTSPAAVIRAVPRWVDYQYGKTLVSAAVSFIPRVLWPGKPVLNIGHEFGHTFGLVNMVDVETLVACTLAGELYWNFGVTGVVVWAFLMGFVFRWVYRRFGEGGEDDGIRKALYIALLIKLMASEGQQALLVVSLVRTIALYYAFVWVLVKLRWVVREPKPAAAVA
jgi:hypothetical protein